MTTDRELLEAAAQAAGYRLRTDENWIAGELPYYHLMDEGHRLWRPLTDDGDALRLAVKLAMRVEVWPEPIDGMQGLVNFRDSELRIDAASDVYATTRRAIVRAAAALNKDPS
jgi:hypothetical protein